MKPLFVLILFFACKTVSAQVSPGELRLLEKLDSVQNSEPPANHFAGLYITATSNAILFWQTRSEQERNLNRRFETRFASFFFAATDSYSNRRNIPEEWKDYFRHNNISQLQYKLLGINAHINGDIRKALTTEFSPAELKIYKASFLAFNHKLKQQYFDLYYQAVNEKSKSKIIHYLTFGIAKWYGSQMLLKWRKRQMKIANLYFVDQESYLRKEKSLSKKKLRLDKAILKFF